MAENCPKDVLSALGGPPAFDENSVGQAGLFNAVRAQVRSATFNPIKVTEFKKGAKVEPMRARTWGYICGIPGPIHLSGVYTVEEDSRPHFPGCPYMMRLKEMPGVKFIAGDFRAVT